MALAAGEKVSLPAVMSAALISSLTPSVIAMPLFFSVPLVASDAIFTDCSALAGESLGSLNPKSLVVSG